MKLNYRFLFYLVTVFSTPVVSQENGTNPEEDGVKILDDISNSINEHRTTWTAKKPTDIFRLFASLRKLPIIPKDPRKVATLSHRTNFLGNLPEFFDSRTVWSKCEKIISRVRNQGECGSCWAVNSASVISDRACIGSNGAILFHASAEDILSCCNDCVAFPDNICGGGYGARAFQYWKKSGVVSGGELNIHEGCKPYSLETFVSRTSMTCEKTCTNKYYSAPYEKDKVYGEVAYRVSGGEKEIMYEMLNHGPVMALVVVYEDMFVYEKGVYQHEKGKMVTNHFVKLLGWGVEGGQKYWLGINSWGPNWGMQGFFKILRGENHCDVEAEISAGRILSDPISRKWVVARANLYEQSLVQDCYLLLLLFLYIR